MTKKDIKKNNSKKKGFSVMELIIAIFISTLIMTATAGVFSNLAKGYKEAKATQQAWNQLQYTLEIMAKSIRTGEIVYPATVESASGRIRFLNNSNDECVEYNLKDNDINVSTHASDTAADCKSRNFVSSETSQISSVYIGSLLFDVTPTVTTPGSEKTGKVYAEIKFCSGDAFCTNPYMMGTFISLRN